jgi:tetratricopeptide (TPR) repeat protein
MRAVTGLLVAAMLCAGALTASAAGHTMARQLLTIAHQWARINYQLPDKAKEAAFTKLEAQAEALAKRYPRRPEPKVWEAIVISTHAGIHGGFGALSMVRHARDLLLAASKIDPDTLHGAIYTSLGSLYYQVPGWPLGFGDDDKAETYLKKALALNPDGIDPNYFYGDYLHRQGHDRQALVALNKALQAPPRPRRSLADRGRRRDVLALIRKIRRNG